MNLFQTQIMNMTGTDSFNIQTLMMSIQTMVDNLIMTLNLTSADTSSILNPDMWMNMNMTDIMNMIDTEAGNLGNAAPTYAKM